ncbi:MAG TPA: DUF885 family protein [Allosphingosinicella sp.]|uniref:DUF885 domain-containing protein n=1 Tax=Allosphingosinicella sp. TaxID=2823234 RepID=UPI002F2A7108
MDRRRFLGTAGAFGVAAALPGCATTGRSGSEDQRLRAVLDRIFYQRLETSPETATSLGLDKGGRAHLRFLLNDESAASRTGEQARAQTELNQLRTINRTRLGDNAAIDYDVVEYGLSTVIRGARFPYGAGGDRYTPYVLSHLSGRYRTVPDFLDTQHPIETKTDVDAYLARLSAFARAIDANSELQRRDAERGVFAPDYLLDRTLEVMKGLRDQPAAGSQLVTSLARRAKAARIPGDHGATAEKIVATAVYPALDRQRALVTQLRGRAVHDAGVWRLPDGEAYYAGALEASTTTKLGAEEIHRLGLEQVAQLEAELDPILRAAGLTRGTAGERLAELNQRPDQVYPNTDAGKAALVAELDRQIAEMYARLPQAFATLPKARVEARRVPVSIQAGSPGAYYEIAPLDGSRPGQYFINLRDTFDRPKFGLRTLTHHEAVPGHHMQGTLALESPHIPLIRRHAYYSAYGEGWALYAEQLADELGMYEGRPFERAGMLQSFLFRATRLVVDTGIHAKRWSREQATDYFIRTTGIARGRSQNEIDRYTAWPGQATSYKVGHLTWVRLREQARTKLGDRFDLKQFHEILRLGTMPLAVLERVVAARAAAQVA